MAQLHSAAQALPIRTISVARWYWANSATYRVRSPLLALPGSRPDQPRRLHNGVQSEWFFPNSIQASLLDGDRESLKRRSSKSMSPAWPHTSRVQIRRTLHFMSEVGLLLRRTLPLLAPLRLLRCGVMQERSERTHCDIRYEGWNGLSTTAAPFPSLTRRAALAAR